MKKGLLALLLISLVAAIPACKQRDCNDESRGCNPCGWFKCKPKCDKEERVEKKKKCCSPCGWLSKCFRCKPKCDREEPVRKKKKCGSCNPCDWFKCKPKCDREEEMREDEEMMREDDMAMARDRAMRDNMAPAARMK